MSGEFIATNKKISFSQDINIGIAGIDYTAWVLFGDAIGGGIKGNAYLEIDQEVIRFHGGRRNMNVRKYGYSERRCCIPVEVGH